MKKIILLFIVSSSILGTYAQQDTARVVGYLPSYRFTLSSQIEYCKLTHLNLSFANPKANGILTMSGNVNNVMTDARSQNPNIKIYISLAGGAVSSSSPKGIIWSNLIDTPANRPDFIHKIIQYVNMNQFDGVDIDLEWSAVTSGYSGFVTELKDSLDKYDKGITAALPNTRFSNINQEALNAFDFINIMAYDATGSWAPSNFGQHSSYNYALSGINLWQNSNNNIPKERLTLGIPFYGYNFISPTSTSSFTFAEIVSLDTNNAKLNQVSKMYYNGIPLIQSKVELAKLKTSGIMIWEIGQDSFDKYSLLSAIHDRYTILNVHTTGLCGNYPVGLYEKENSLSNQIYPNPATNEFMIFLPQSGDVSVQITNTIGQNISIKSTQNTNQLIYNTATLPRGVYIINVTQNEKHASHKLILN